ncbi:Dabb family protein [Saccharopolyspora spinosa]|uniref:Stress responsive alpha/beta barrel protein n=2 Tax=Saccharopolyspora spinosa TaxID=60894 RepID=A0A2N3XZQ2_SACSN|nr:Dabb family protein [Saccharopolyspora spinosa]PKW16154.1 stress responsive alpha/beta barrel protein [Saccharopolyspora spinosa]
MSITHIAMFRFRDGVTDDQIAKFEAELATMPERTGCLQAYRYGRDLGARDGNFDFGVVAELGSADEIDGYLDHPAHLELVRDHVLHIVAERKAVQFSTDALERHLRTGKTMEGRRA